MRHSFLLFGLLLILAGSTVFAGIGVSYSDIIQDIESYFEMKRTTNVDGSYRISGITKDNFTVIGVDFREINNVSYAYLMLIFPEGNSSVRYRNKFIMLKFLGNIFSDYPTDIMEWAQASMSQLALHGGTVSIPYEGKIVVMRLAQPGIFMITIGGKS